MKGRVGGSRKMWLTYSNILRRRVLKTVSKVLFFHTTRLAYWFRPYYIKKKQLSIVLICFAHLDLTGWDAGTAALLTHHHVELGSLAQVQHRYSGGGPADLTGGLESRATAGTAGDQPERRHEVRLSTRARIWSSMMTCSYLYFSYAGFLSHVDSDLFCFHLERSDSRQNWFLPFPSLHAMCYSRVHSRLRNAPHLYTLVVAMVLHFHPQRLVSVSVVT